jgi:outer membrane lipoprotein-sorting protein
LTTTQGTTQEIWVDTSSNILVKSSTTTSGSTTSMILKTLKNGTPAAELFTVPSSGYKVMSY